MTHSPLRIVFAGTPDFSVASLAELYASTHELLWVYTQPDAVSGRGKQFRASPVKMFAESNGIACEQPRKLGVQEAQALVDQRVDVLVVVAYGQIVPASVLAAPRLGCINVHGSLLPRWRGAAPLQRAILAGDSTFGVCVMQMDRGLDTGPVYIRAPLSVDSTSVTAGELSVTMAHEGARLLLRVLADPSAFPLQKQSERGVCYAHKISKDEALIDWTRSSVCIDRHVRAFNPWPMAYSFLNGSRIRVASVFLEDGLTSGERPGTVLDVGPTGVLVACQKGLVRITKLQFPGKKMQVSSQHLIKKGMVFTTP